ncbi:syntaxin-2-like isoform X1 [Xiphophorus couchianus]|uniref:syntaxin-2-like isoform X1 n=1 Tax=Xiphophorus couchianus TaxID=32473 RepID=UPI001016657B|nr:syntaxin-2-like isoform X1 [Xiphophorus couchianus]
MTSSPRRTDRLQSRQTDTMSNSTTIGAEMEEFFETVGEIRNLIEKISSQTEDMEKIHCCILSSSHKGSKDELELINNETRNNAKLVQTKLKLMLKNCSSEDNKTNNSVICRIRRNQHSHLTRWFSEVMKSYHKIQISFREKCKAQIQRHLEIVDKVTTDDELEDMLQRDNLAIFVSNIHFDAQFSSLALSEIEGRHQDIISLECSIKELHEIFTDTAILLEMQGELINNIEKNVTSAGGDVRASKEETQKALEYKKNPYKVVSLPSFFKSFRRQTNTKAADESSSEDCIKYS